MNVKKLLIYEDDSIIIFNKPQGIPTATGKIECFCEYIFNVFTGISSVKGYKEGEGGLLNRLDNETGGLVLFAKTDDAFKYYQGQMRERKIKKFYKAVVEGIPDGKRGSIVMPIAHHYKKKKKMVCIQEDSKYRGKPKAAKTFYKLLKSNGKLSLLDILIKKGVRHQIRVHLSFEGIPIVGDKLYNKNKNTNDYHLLYAYALKFINFYGNKVNIKIDVPFENMIF